jgi:hypothetical protein
MRCNRPLCCSRHHCCSLIWHVTFLAI